MVNFMPTSASILHNVIVGPPADGEADPNEGRNPYRFDSTGGGADGVRSGFSPTRWDGTFGGLTGVFFGPGSSPDPGVWVAPVPTAGLFEAVPTDAPAGPPDTSLCSCGGCTWSKALTNPPTGGNPYENGSGDPAAAIAFTGVVTIDAVLWGSRWTDGFITYSDTDSTADYQAGYFAGDFTNYGTGFSQLTAQQLAAAHGILNQALYTQNAGLTGLSVEAFTNLGIDYQGAGAGNSTIRMANTSSANLGTARVADFPENNIWGGDVWYGGSGDTPTAGNYDYATTIHELGHALGLKHGHQASNRNGGGAPVLPTATDSMEFSIMTYRSFVGGGTGGYTNEQWGYAQTFMMYDIRALQELYGADFTANGGDTVYTWTPGSGNTVINGQIALEPGGNRIFATLWDGNGIDTYDLSAYTTNLSIDLNPGGWSVFSTAQLADLDQFSGDPARVARGNIFNALQFNGDMRSLIENAIGGSGDDTIIGNAANNTLTGNGGIDTLYGGFGNDTLQGGFTTDTVFGQDGNDTIRVLAGEFYDNVDGGSGVDVLDHSLSDYSGSTFDFSTGQITGSFINGTSATLSSIEVYYDGSGGNTIISSGASHTYYGFGGNDTMIATAGGETMYGGAGIDVLDLRVGNFVYTFDMTTGLAAEYPAELFLEFETVLLGSANDTVTGDFGDNTINGGGGNDTLRGGGGTDRVLGGGGNDLIIVAFGDGLDNANGGNGTDTLDYSGTFGDITFNMVTGAFEFGGVARVATEFERFRGGEQTDFVIGTDGANLIFGNGGNDTLNGGAGIDTLRGGEGNDTYVVDTPLDVVIETGTGIDTVRSAGSYTLGNRLENLVLTGSGDTSGTGNNLANNVTGNAGNNALNGKEGIDTLRGGLGDDTYTVQQSMDRVIEAAGEGTDTVRSLVNYVLSDNVENLVLVGSDVIRGTGNGLANLIVGNSAGNLLDGGEGSDTLRGMGGNDGFLFSTALGASNVDHIFDFATGDRIRLDQDIFTELSLGGLAASAFKDITTGAIDADDRIIYNSGNGNLWYDANGSGGGQRVLFAVLDNHAVLTRADFLIV
jgi:serralysin